MPKFYCPCGHRIAIHDVVEPEEYVLIRETDVHNQCESMPEEGPVMSEEQFYGFIREKGLDVLICPKCERIHVDHNNDDLYTSYVKEEFPQTE